MFSVVWYAFRPALRTVWAAIRARPMVFMTVALAVFLLNIILPPLVLSLVRKPWDYFTFNPWLSQLPKWLVSPEATIGRKLTFVWGLVVFWFAANGQADEPEWGFSVGVHDLFRWAFVAFVFGAYFALWFYARRQLLRRGQMWGSGGRGGFMGALLSTLGLSTAPCSVIGCGAPILPVLGLAFQGLTSGVLATLATLSRVANEVLLVGMSVIVLILGRFVSLDSGERHERTGARLEDSPTKAMPTG